MTYNNYCKFESIDFHIICQHLYIKVLFNKKFRGLIVFLVCFQVPYVLYWLWSTFYCYVCHIMYCMIWFVVFPSCKRFLGGIAQRVTTIDSVSLVILWKWYLAFQGQNAVDDTDFEVCLLIGDAVRLFNGFISMKLAILKLTGENLKLFLNNCITFKRCWRNVLYAMGQNTCL